MSKKMNCKMRGKVKAMTAWILALAMMMTNVEYVSAADASLPEGKAMVAQSATVGTEDGKDVSENGTVFENIVVGTRDGGDITSGDVVKPIVYHSGEAAVVSSGDMDGVIWEVTSDGVLNISGKNTSSSTTVKYSYPWHAYKNEVTKVVVTAENVKIMDRWFNDFKYLTTVDLSGADTSTVTSMAIMFTGCSNLTDINLAGVDTSNVTYMSNMFSECTSLSELDLSGFDTSNVTSFYAMFRSCRNLTKLNISSFDTSKAQSMGWMFWDCVQLQEVDVSGFDTSQVVDMSEMFSGCYRLKELDVSGFDTSNVQAMNNMFYSCQNVSYLDVSGFDTSNVTDMSQMFSYCNALDELDVGNFDTSKVTNMADMFRGCTSLDELDISGFDTSKVTDMSAMFCACDSLSSIDLSGLNLSSVTTMSWMFSGCDMLTKVELSGLDMSKVTDMSYLFYESPQLSSLDLRGSDISSVTNMRAMCEGCSSLEEVHLEGLDTSNVKSMVAMFSGCSNLKELNLSGLDTSSVTSMSGMFEGCTNLAQLDLAGLETANVISMSYMFKGCESLTELDFSSFDVSSVTNMSYMFYGCKGLTGLDLCGFVTSNLEDLELMFYGCNNLVSLDISNFNLAKISSMSSNWLGGTSLVRIKWMPGVQLEIKVPKTLYDSVGNMYDTYFPQNLTEATWLYATTSNSGVVDGLTWRITDKNELFITGEYTGSTNVSAESWPWLAYSDVLQSVYVVEAENITTMDYWFWDCSKIKKIKFWEVDTSRLESMFVTFKGCSSLETLDVSNFDMDRVSNVEGMFVGCTGLKTLRTFQNLGQTIELPGNMFDDAFNLYTECPKELAEELWLYRADAYGEVNGIKWTIGNDTLFITGTDTSTEVSTSESWPWHEHKDSFTKVVVSAQNVKSTSYWFKECSNITSIDLSEFDSGSVQNMQGMFRGCTAIEKLDLSGLDISNVTNMNDMLAGCTMLSRLNVIQNLKLNVELPSPMFDEVGNMYKTCPLGVTDELWIYIPYKGGEINGITWMLSYDSFYESTLYIRGRADSTEMSTTQWPWLKYCSDVTKVVVTAENVQNVSGWFEGFPRLYAVDFTGFDTGNITDMSNLFKDCTNLSTLDVSDWDISSVTNMTGMFEGCTDLTELKTFKNLTLNVALPIVMFDEEGNRYTSCPLGLAEGKWLYTTESAGEVHGITWMLSEDGTLYIRGEDTSTEAAAEPAWGWLDYADEIKKVVISATNVKSTAGWFDGCTKLKTVDITKFDTSTVTDMSAMFRNCSSLVTLNLSSMDVSAVTNMTDMLAGCTGLKNFKVIKNLTMDVALPVAMYDEMANRHTACPKNIAEDMWLYVSNYAGEVNGIFWIITKDGTLVINGTDTSADATTSTDWGWLAHTGKIKKAKLYAKNVKSTSGWFDGCSVLTEVDMSTFDMAAVTASDKMFNGCLSLVKVNTPINLAMDVALPVELVDEQGVSYTSLPKNKTTSILLEQPKASGIYYGMNWALVGNGNLLISGAYAEKADTDKFWGSYAKEIKSVKVRATGVWSTADWFKDMSSLETVDISGLDMSQITDMSRMFDGCSNLADLDISDFDTSNVTKMTGMFKDCSGLTKLDMAHFDLLKVTDATDMLSGCTGIEEIRVPANLAIDIEVPKTLYNYLGEPQTDYFPKHQPEAEWYYAVSPVGEGELHVSKVYPQTYTGKAIKPVIRVYDGATRLVEKKDYTISFKNNTKAASQDAVNAKGKSVAPTIIVKGKGNYTKSETITFDILAKDIAAEDVTCQELVAVAGKKVQKPVPKLTYNGKKLVKGKDFTVSYPDLEDKTKVDAYKVAGVYRVVVTGKGNFTGTRELLFTITDGTLMSKVKVSKIPAQQYTGKAIEPAIKVTFKKTELVAEKDYTVTYKNNTEIGKASVILTGMGAYAGTKTITFQIVGQSIAKATVSGIEDKVYNGQAQTQKVKVALEGKTLKAETDYTVSYAKNVNAGTATLTVTGKGAYSGSVKKTFKITPYDLESNSKKLFAGMPKNLKVAYEKGGSMPVVALTFGGADMTAKKDYTISYSNNKKVADAKDAKAPTIIIKGKGNYKGTVSVAFSITSKALNDAENPVMLRVPDMAYSAKGGKYISKPILTDSNGKKLVAGTDYEKEITYTLEDGTALDKKSVVEAGKIVTVKVTGKGYYSGTMEATYKITQASFKSAKIKIEPKAYTCKAVTLSKEDIVVKMGSETLTYGVDYEIVEDSYKNNVKKGNATVTIKGLGNYGGEKTVKFKIVSKNFVWFWRLFG